MKRSFNASVTREGVWYVAQALEVDVASQGLSEDEALGNLREALELYFQPPAVKALPKIRRVEVEIAAAPSWIGCGRQKKWSNLSKLATDFFQVN